MKIAIFNWRHPADSKSGGAEQVTLKHAQHWVDRGHQVWWISGKSNHQPQYFESGGINFFDFGPSSIFFLYAWLIYWLKYRGDFDVVIDEVHGLPAFSPLWAKKSKVVTFIHEVAGPIWFEMYSWPVAMVGWMLERLALRWVHGGTKFWVDASSAELDLVGLGIDQNSIKVIPCAIDQVPTYKSRTGRQNKPLTLIFLARLVKMKGIESALEVVAHLKRKVPDVQLWVVGTGNDEYVAEIKKRVESLGISKNIVFFGRVKNHQKYYLLAQADFLLHTSIKEGFGLTVLEANSQGTPAAVFDVAALRELVVNARTGIVAPKGDVVWLAKSIYNTYRQAARYNRIRSEAANWQKLYSWPKFCQQSTKLLDSIVENKTVGGIMSKRDYLPLAKPVLGKEEEQAVIEAMRSGWITLGPKTAEFETEFAKYIGCKHAIAVNSCTAALDLALYDLHMKPGDEVIIPAFTFAATANTVIHAGGTPVIVDVDANTFCIDPKAVEKKMNKKTVAIVAMHYAGFPADMKALQSLVKKHKLKLIEDAATAVGSKYDGKMIGNEDHAVCFSFHPIKNMTTGDGGMLTTNDSKMAKRLKLLRLQGMDKESWKRIDKNGSWFYEIVAPGFKFNMTDISAAMGLVQLKRLEGFIQDRTRIVNQYKARLEGLVEFQATAADIRHSHNLFPILISKKLIKKRDQIIEDLKSKQIGANVYYIPLHFHPFYQQEFGWKKGDAPVTESIFERLINLPLYPTLTTKDVDYICDELVKLLK